jgi:hypothetical protein
MSWLTLLREMPQSSDDVCDVNGVDLELLVPEKLHLLAEVLVDSGDD